MGDERLGLTLSATIDRTDFGIDWNLDLPTGGKALANEVGLNVVLEFVRA
jgi:polyisoprenoid-binding protein YceI